MIQPPVDEIRVIQRQLRGAVDDVVRRLHTEHETVILVPDFVSPGPEPAARVDVVVVLQGRKQLLQDALALEGWGRVAMVEAAVVGADDFVRRLQHGGVEEAGDGVGEHAILVHGLEGGFADFEHDGPVGPLFCFFGARRGAVGELQGRELDGGLGLVVGGVVGEDGGAVEGAI